MADPQRVLGAFVLGAPGTYVEERPGVLVVGNRPGGTVKALAAVMLAFGLGLAWFLWAELPWLGVLLGLLFGGVPLLALLNRQRWEVRRQHLALRGRALGHEVERDYPLAPDAAIRLGTRVEYDQDGSTPRWTTWQAQVRTAQGWVAVAESAQEGPAREFAQRLARVTGLPLQA